MAIPFALPCDADCTHASEAHLEQLLWDLIDIYQQIQQIQILLRSRMHNRMQATPMTARVCATPRGERTRVASVVVVPDLVASNLPPPLDADADGVVDALSMPTLRRSRWQPTPTIEFKPSYYRDSILTDCTLSQSDEFTTLASTAPPSTDCIDAGVTPPAASRPPPAKSLFARLMPTSTTSCSLWTAVLCVLGWRLFRAR